MTTVMPTTGGILPNRKVPPSVDRLRAIIMFVIAWLVGLSVLEIAKGALNGMWGVALAALTVAVNMYARKRALRDVERSRSRWIWEKLPIVLFVVVPLLVRLISLIWHPESRGWWPYFKPIVSIVLTLGVPVGALFYIYLMLNRLRAPAGVQQELTEVTETEIEKNQ